MQKEKEIYLKRLARTWERKQGTMGEDKVELGEKQTQKRKRYMEIKRTVNGQQKSVAHFA